MRETRRVAEREWPPREKKSESRETESRPRTWEKSRERSSSVGPRGGEKDSVRESGRGSAARALRSTLPEEERGRESRTRRREGTMASGREEERDERRARKS